MRLRTAIAVLAFATLTVGVALPVKAQETSGSGGDVATAPRTSTEPPCAQDVQPSEAEALAEAGLLPDRVSCILDDELHSEILGIVGKDRFVNYRVQLAEQVVEVLVHDLRPEEAAAISNLEPGQHLAPRTALASRAELLGYVEEVKEHMPSEGLVAVGLNGDRVHVSLNSGERADVVRRIVPTTILDLNLDGDSRAMHGSRDSYPPYEGGRRVLPYLGNIALGKYCSSGPLYYNGFGFFATMAGHCGGTVMRAALGSETVGTVTSNPWNGVPDGGSIIADVLYVLVTNGPVNANIYTGPTSDRAVKGERTAQFQAGTLYFVSRGHADQITAGTVNCANPCSFNVHDASSGATRHILVGGCGTATVTGGDSGSPVYAADGAGRALVLGLVTSTNCYSQSEGVRFQGSVSLAHS